MAIDCITLSRAPALVRQATPGPSHQPSRLRRTCLMLSCAAGFVDVLKTFARLLVTGSLPMLTIIVHVLRCRLQFSADAFHCIECRT